MSSLLQRDISEPRSKSELALFIRRWAAAPLQMGAILPSSPVLGRKLFNLIGRRPHEVVVELGAGTGAVSRAMLAAGLPAEALVVVEIVPEMARYLAGALPKGVTVIEGDAFDLPTVLPPHLHGQIGTVICGIPLVLLPERRQQQFVEAVERVAPGRGFLLYSYCLTSPLPYRRLGLSGRREAFIPFNLPPASIWRYRPTPAAAAGSAEKG